MKGKEQFAGSEINWVSSGDDNPDTVLLIHAVGNDLTYWDRQIEALSQSYRVISYDLAGHGSSSGEPDNLSFDQSALIVADLIENVSKQPVHLVGISFGGMIAQETVLARPELVRSLILIATASKVPVAARASMRDKAKSVRAQGIGAVLQADLESWFTPEFRERRPDVVDRVSKTVLAGDPEVQASLWNIIADFDVNDRLGEIKCPTLVLGGDRDQSTPPATIALLAGGIRGAKMVILPGVSHIATVEAPKAVNNELLKFLNSVVA